MPCLRCAWPPSAAATIHADAEGKRLVTVGARQVIVLEAAGDYATRLWFSSMQLASWLASHAECFMGSTVLEVGAGTGLCSLALASAAMASGHGASTRLIATDISTRGLELLGEAARAQELENIITCTPFDVGGDAALPAEADWLVASDVLYTPQLARALARRCVEIARRGGRAIVADPGRPTRRLFQVLLEQEGFRGDFAPMATTVPGTRPIVLLHVDGERSVSLFAAHAELHG